MSYLTTLKIAQTTGLGVEVVDEKLGEGDGSKVDYDLENDNVVAGSYTISYADAGSNDFTDLTEITHYTLDKDSGRIVLESAGASLVSGKVLYAKYVYCPKMSDTIINTYIAPAEAEVKRRTGRNWDTPSSVTEVFDGEEWYNYPRTDQPFARDYDPANYVVVSQKNVTEIEEVALLAKGIVFSKVFSDDGGSFTDNTTEANTYLGTSFYAFASTPAVSDAIYFGVGYMFHGIIFNLQALGVGSVTVVWEYYDGSTWTSFTPTEVTSGTASFTANGKITWDALDSWTKTVVNSSSSLYFVRVRISAGSYSTSPKIYTCTLDQESVISQFINPAYIDFTSGGRVTLNNFSIPNGVKNIRIKYKYGSSTTPEDVKELAALYAGLRAYAYITGGSYDDETGFTFGRKSVSIGEVYVNVREVVKQFRERINELLKIVGTRNFFSA